MEEMDIEQVVDIPDTPDRLTARHINGAKSGKGSNSSAPGPSRTDFRDKECLTQCSLPVSCQSKLPNIGQPKKFFRRTVTASTLKNLDEREKPKK